MSDPDDFRVTEDGVIVLENGAETRFRSDERDDGQARDVRILPNGWVRLQYMDYQVEFHPPDALEGLYTHNDVKL